MADNKDGQEKTEDATEKRLSEARMKGQVAKSQELTTAAVILIGGSVIFLMGGPMISEYIEFMKFALENSGTVDITYTNTIQGYHHIVLFLAKILLPILFIVFLIILAAEISQVGLKIATKKFTEGLNFKQIFNPFSGMKKIFFSTRSIFELAKSLAKLFVLGFVVWGVLDDNLEDTFALMERPLSEMVRLLADLSLELFLKVGAVYIAIAVADILYQKHKFATDMKMTKQEVKEEGKQAEGDPKLKARIRGIMRQKIRKLMMANVKNADVIITNPTHFAVAIEYKTGEMSAPKVVAKGADFIAKQIRERGAAAGIPIIEQKELARAIYFNVEVEEEIPENLFKAVAQILAYVFNMKRENPSKLLKPTKIDI